MDNLYNLSSCPHVRSNLTTQGVMTDVLPVPYTHLRSHETKANLVCRLLLVKNNKL